MSHTTSTSARTYTQRAPLSVPFRSPIVVPLRLATAALLVSCICILPGCYDPIFREDEARSQYDRFDAVRDQRAAQYFFDEFGNRKPNIRGRLLGRE